MRQLVITIYQRPGVTTDNIFNFNSQDSYFDSQIYQFLNLNLNYSVISSQITSTLILSMNQPIGIDNVLRSGQPIQITDNGEIIFQGVLLAPNYTLVPMSETSQGGTFLIATLAPSIYQLTLTPMIFDSAQAAQVQQLTGVDTSAILIGRVTQSIQTTNLLSYMVTNTDYSNFFMKSISAQDLADNVYLMTSAGESRDITLRQSIDYYNCVFYQQEDGNIIIRQLDAAIESPFDIDLANSSSNEFLPADVTPIVPLLAFEYNDNAYSTPAVISNYCMLQPDQAIGGKATQCVLSYAPNPIFFPRLKQLEIGGWFTGQIGQTQINNNIISDPTTLTALNTFFEYPDQYMIKTKATGVESQELASYQALLTAKQTGMALTGYATINATISLDDPHLPAKLGNVVGSILQIQNCDLTSGLIATVSRSYSTQGSYMNLNITPLGSYTGYWKNSTTTPTFV